MFYPPEITLAAAFPMFAWLIPIAIILPVDVLVVGTLLLVATRARRSVTESSLLPGAYGGRRYWKYGFYVNPDDSRLWVPRSRRGQSKTINIGHPNGIRALALFIIALTLLPTLSLTVVFLVLSLTLPR